jgi:cytochrome c oxidase cbb3-type subunit IV
MDIGIVHSIWTVLMLVLFIGICVWAFSRRRKGAFDAAAQLPFDDDNSAQSATRGENKHG